MIAGVSPDQPSASTGCSATLATPSLTHHNVTGTAADGAEIGMLSSFHNIFQCIVSGVVV